MAKYEQKFGVLVEENIIKSLKMAGVPLKTSGDLDHNCKIDFILNLKGQDVGIQFSMNSRDMIKAKVAKILALEAVPRFIYLNLPSRFFKQPDKQNGEDLYKYLNNIAGSHKEKALSIYIDEKGSHVSRL